VKRHQLEHLLRAAGSITGCDEIYVIGSQAILATIGSGPEELFLSREADVLASQGQAFSTGLFNTKPGKPEGVPKPREGRQTLATSVS